MTTDLQDLTDLLRGLGPGDRLLLPLSMTQEALGVLRGEDAGLAGVVERQVRISREVEGAVILRGKEKAA